MTVAVTGATGRLGGLVIEALIKAGVAPAEVVAIVRDTPKAAALAERGVQIRVANYDQPSALESALTGVEKLLLISGSEVGLRIAQHHNIIDAAEKANVALIAYTSVLNADTSGISLAREHIATEQRVLQSSADWAVLRNGWYWENYAVRLAQTLSTGVMLGSAGTGRVAGAARTDYAAAAAAVLTSDDHAGKIYELGGGERLTYSGIADTITEVSGTPVRYQDLPEAQYRSALIDAGLPESLAARLADADAGIARGELDTQSDDLRALIGRASTPLAEVLRTALGATNGGRG